MKKSNYEIDGDLYKFDNEKFKNIIKSRNPSRGAYEQFYRKVVSLGKGISYDAVKGWVKNNTNPSNLDDVKLLAEILEVPYKWLLKCTHYSVEAVNYRLQRITFREIEDPFALKYDGFSNIFDVIIGMGYNSETKECKDSDFAERIINIIGTDKISECGFPELLGYKFVYSDEELQKMTDEELSGAITSGYVDNEGNCLYDKNGKILIDRHKFGERLIKNTSWLNDEEREALKEVIEEAEKWWEDCDMPFSLLKINIAVCEQQLTSFTYGMGWAKPTHEDRWRLILDLLEFLGSCVHTAGLCWIREMHVDQFEGEFFVTIELQ